MLQVNPIIFVGNTGKHYRETLYIGKYNIFYREKAARIIEIPYYSVSLLCLQGFPTKIVGFTYDIYNFTRNN